MGRHTVRFIGERKHNLEVLEIYPQDKGGRHIQLKLLCHSCGNTTVQSSVVFNKAKSCGCQRHRSSSWKSVGPKKMPWQLPEGEAARRLLIHRYKGSARRKNLSFTLDDAQLTKLFKSPCKYCGQTETNVSKGLGRTSGNYSYVGLDRINPALGYVENNVVPCCWVCNMMKNTLEEDYFLNHIKRIATHRGLYNE